MIKTTFRIEVETPQMEDNPLDAFGLSRVFKCAPARLVENRTGGLPVAAAAAADADAADGADASDAVADAVRTAGDLLAQLVATTGRKITPEAINVYRETQAMRRSFGIPTQQRTNIDPSRKLPKIMAEPFEKFDPEKLVSAARLPKTQADLVADVENRFPRTLPRLTLRVSILHRPMWDADDPVARQNWKKVVLPQTKAMVAALQRDLLRMEAPNNLTPEIRELLRFERLDLRFDQYVLSVANEGTNRFGDVDAALERFYELLNDGTLDPETTVRVDAPFIDHDAILAAVDPGDTEAADGGGDAAGDDDAAGGDDAAAPSGEEADEGEAAATDVEASAETPATDEPAATDDETGGEAGDEAPSEPSGEEEPEPVSRTHGIQAVRLAEQTIVDARENVIAFRMARAERAAAEQQAVENLRERGIDIPVSERATTWGVIDRSAAVRYLNSMSGAWRDRPEQDDRVDIVAYAAQVEAEAAAAENAEAAAGADAAASAGDATPGASSHVPPSSSGADSLPAPELVEDATTAA